MKGREINKEEFGIMEKCALDAHAELLRTIPIHGWFNSAHEGYAVLLEELDELWEEIKTKTQDHGAIYTEAKQVAAMALELMTLHVGQIGDEDE